MKSGQVVTGIINGIADSYETPDILQLLPNNKLSELTSRETVGTYRRVYLTDRVVSQTVVTKAEPDELGRDGTVNHTVLYKFDRATEHDGARYVFDVDDFAENAKAGKYNFPMPPMPELKHPLDLPPVLEMTP
jgi:hypothetical protein